MTPFFSCICVTYGRTEFLSEAIAAFLSQDFKDAELVIYNTCPEQDIMLDAGLKDPNAVYPQINTINVKTRPSSLGKARNEAIEFSTGKNLVVWDDDDVALPNYLSTLAKHFSKPNVDFVFLEQCFFAEKYKITKIMPGSGNLFTFSRQAWKAVGGYGEVSVGEDVQMIGKVSEKFQGVRVPLAPKEIPFVYCWGQGTFHASGLGVDREGQEPLYVRIERDLQARIKSGEEPTGEIILKPEFKHDWNGIVMAFLRDNYGTDSTKRNNVCIVQLGSVGDIVNVLPILKWISDNYQRPYLMVSKENASILDGVSYVTPYVTDLPPKELDKAVEQAKKIFQFVLVSQTWGKNYSQVQNCSAANIESWRNLGFENRFEDRSWMPVFDNLGEDRSPRILAGNIVIRTGDSKIKNLIYDAFPEMWVAPASLSVRQMNGAAALVTDDTDLIHLAAASNVPVVAIVESHPWLTVAPRCNVVQRLTREQVAAHPEDLVLAVKAAIASTFPPVQVSPAVTAPTRRIFHAYDWRNTTHLKDQERIARAKASWIVLYDQGVIPCPYQEKNRTADKEIGDTRELPYLKDVLKNAMNQMELSDICFWTNDDVWLHTTLPDLLRFQVSVYGAVTASRREFMRGLPDNLADKTPEQIAKMGVHHLGFDLFAATKQWLVDHWNDIGDYILGTTLFDIHLAYLCRIDKGIRFDQGTLENNVWPSELPAGMLAHEHHFPQWANDPESQPSFIHNRTIYNEWFAANKNKLEP